MKESKAYIYFQNGDFLEAKAIGKCESLIAEFVVLDCISGHQEAMTNPSYKDKFIVFSMPEVGIVGTNSQDYESDKFSAAAIFARKINTFTSNFRSQENIEAFLQKHCKCAIYDIDTRYLVKLISKNHGLKAVVSTEISDKNMLKNMLDNNKVISDKKCCGDEIYEYKNALFNFDKLDYDNQKPLKKLAVINFDIKNSLLQEFVNVKFQTFLTPCDSKKIMGLNVDAIALYSGNFDNKEKKSQIFDELKKMNLPIIAIGDFANIIKNTDSLDRVVIIKDNNIDDIKTVDDLGRDRHIRYVLENFALDV